MSIFISLVIKHKGLHLNKYGRLGYGRLVTRQTGIRQTGHGNLGNGRLGYGHLACNHIYHISKSIKTTDEQNVLLLILKWLKFTKVIVIVIDYFKSNWTQL